MIKLCQRDPRWAAVKLGQSSLTIGRYGCTTTAISMLTDYFKFLLTPDVLAQKILRYTNDGLILWPSCNNISCMKFETRRYGFVPVEIDISLADPNKAVILSVANNSHWVTALSKIPFSKNYLIADPWDGKVKSSKAYGDISGSAHFIKK